MIKISGYVAMQRANIGIPNLVVAAYDSEKSAQELISEHRKEEGFAPAIMKQLGKSIGSVLTDKRGAFFFSPDDLKFEGTKPRPNLLVVVFAPEDILDIKTPVPLPPNKRILYISSVPRVEAGAEEAYIIRLLKDQVDKFNISLQDEPNGKDNTQKQIERHLSALDNTDRLRETLKEKLKPRLVKQIDQNTETKKMIKEKLKNFSAIPHTLRDNQFLLKDSKDTPKMQREIAVEGLKKIQTLKNTFNINLSKDDLKSLDIKLDDNGGKVETLSLIKKMQELVGGIDLIRKTEILPSAISPEKFYNKYFKGTNKRKSNDNNIEVG